MKVLFTVDTYKPHLDGIQFVTSYLAEGLALKGHDVQVFTCAYPELTSVQEEIIENVRVKRFNSKNLSKEKVRDIQKYVLKISKEYDVIINVGVQSFFTNLYLPILSHINVPIFLHVHSIFDFRVTKNDFSSVKRILRKIYHIFRSGFYFIKNKKNFNLYTNVIQLHEKSYGYQFFKNNLGIESIILENAVEEKFFVTGEHIKKNQIVYVANYMKDKDQIRCVDLFMKSQLNDSWSLILIGAKKSSYYKKLISYCEKKYASALGTKIDIRVGISRDELCNTVKESSLFLMTSRMETFPISIVEAMAAKIPFISSDVGIVKYLSGGIIAHNDKEFIELINKLTHDKKYRENLGIKGANAAKEYYCIEKKVHQLEMFLFKIVMENEN